MEDKFSWTQEYKMSWEEDTARSAASSYAVPHRPNTGRKNIIRHLHIAIDTSASIEKLDYLPTIRQQLTRFLPPFIERFTTMNPLSTLSFMTCSSTFLKYSRSLDIANMFSTVGDSDFSFLNCIKASIGVLKGSSYTRECLVVTASIGTRDNACYLEICRELKRYNIRVSVISICGEITLFRNVCTLTNGIYAVPLDANHFEILLNDFALPLESAEGTNSLVKFGFPCTTEAPGLCSCHLAFYQNLYECPVCRAPVCTLPADCPICETRLVSPLSISKSYHHVYPSKPFVQAQGVCRCCRGDGAYKCTECGTVYCAACSEFQQNDLNFCVYCG